MRPIKEIRDYLDSDEGRQRILSLCCDEENIAAQRERFAMLLSTFKEHFGDMPAEVFSTPGRTEIGGNHTDHQHGEVLAASVNIDAIAVAAPRQDNRIVIHSCGYSRPIELSADMTDPDPSLRGSSLALVMGLVSDLKNRGHRVGGFNACIASDVISGSGLSSSAAFEVLVGNIISGLWNDMSIPALDLARSGQYSENVFFGKPCGLMDQIACSVGGLVFIDFENPEKPQISSVDYDLDETGYLLCITDTGGSHANLTREYAAIPGEMKQIASFFSKDVLRPVPQEDVISAIPELRKRFSDRAILRALHFYEENKRVRRQAAALKNRDMKGFLEAFRQSGDSSFKYLQNVYPSSDTAHQNTSLALMASDLFLGPDGVARIHGGGFAGTIQAFVKKEKTEEYRKKMNLLFGKNACRVMKIRKHGGIRLI